MWFETMGIAMAIVFGSMLWLALLCVGIYQLMFFEDWIDFLIGVVLFFAAMTILVNTLMWWYNN